MMVDVPDDKTGANDTGETSETEEEVDAAVDTVGVIVDGHAVMIAGLLGTYAAHMPIR